MEDIFQNFGDIFGGGFGGFGGFGGGGGGGRARVNKGSDLRIKVKLNLKEIADGVIKKLKINKLNACDKCGGNGAKDGKSFTTCGTCSGSGYVTQAVNTMFGRMQSTVECPTCYGTGSVITTPCDKCRGEGVVKGEEVVEVRIPAGVGEGIQLSVSGKGNAARRGGVNGDLLVIIEEESHPYLDRDGNDLLYNLSITIPTALSGGSVEVPTIDGKAKIKIKPGTHAGEVLRLKGKGIGDLNGRGRGDILAIVDIAIPTKLKVEDKELIEKMAKSETFQKVDNKKQNVLDRMRSFFRQ